MLDAPTVRSCLGPRIPIHLPLQFVLAKAMPSGLPVNHVQNVVETCQTYEENSNRA